MTPGQCCAGWLAMYPPRPGTMSGRTDGRRWYGSRTSEKCPFFHVAGSDTWRVWTRWWLNGRRSGRNADWSRATPASTDRPMSRTHPVRRCHQRRSSSLACCQSLLRLIFPALFQSHHHARFRRFYNEPASFPHTDSNTNSIPFTASNASLHSWNAAKTVISSLT